MNKNITNHNWIYLSNNEFENEYWGYFRCTKCGLYKANPSSINDISISDQYFIYRNKKTK